MQMVDEYKDKNMQKMYCKCFLSRCS